MKSLALFGAGAIALASAAPAAAQQQVDPALAAQKIAELLQPLPKDFGAGLQMVDAHAEGPLLVVAVELTQGGVLGEWQSGFLEGLCGENKAAMDGLFAAGMRVRPDAILAGKRTQGAVIDHCPASPAAQ